MRIVAAFDTDPMAVSAYRHRVFPGAKVASPQNWAGMTKFNQADVVIARQPSGAYSEHPQQEDLMPNISLVIERVRPRHFVIRVEEDLFEKGRPGTLWVGWWTKIGYRLTATSVKERNFGDGFDKQWLLLWATRVGCPFAGGIPMPRDMEPLRDLGWPDDVGDEHRARLRHRVDSPYVGAVLGEKLRRLDPQAKRIIDVMGGCGDFSAAFRDNVFFRAHRVGDNFFFEGE